MSLRFTDNAVISMMEVSVKIEQNGIKLNENMYHLVYVWFYYTTSYFHNKTSIKQVY